MANFSYNSYSNDSRRNQYCQYLQSQNYVNQIDGTIRETGKMNEAIVEIQTREIQNAIRVSSEVQADAIMQASYAICSTLESGFRGLNYRLEDIKHGIDNLTDLVGHGFSLMIEEQKITNLYLGHIKNLLRISDKQKERVNHIEEGLKFLLNAFRKGPDDDFYTDALEEFQAALAIERKDFLSLYHVGFIFLKSTKHLDPKNAEIYFRNAARYYLAEANVGGTNVSNSLLSHRGFYKESAEAYLFAAEACYLQEKFSEAVELAAEAWKTFPDMAKAGFLQSKYLAANQQANVAVEILEKEIGKDRFLSLEVLPDLDLITKPEIQNLIEKLKFEAVLEAKEKYKLCSNVILPGSIATSYLANIYKLIQYHTFLEAKEAIDLLLVSKKWTISEGAIITSEGKFVKKILSKEFTGSIIDFVKFERDFILAIRADNLFQIKEIERQKAELQHKINEYQLKINSLKSKYRQRRYILGVVIFIDAVAIAIHQYILHTHAINNEFYEFPFTFAYSGIVILSLWFIALFSDVDIESIQWKVEALINKTKDMEIL